MIKYIGYLFAVFIIENFRVCLNKGKLTEIIKTGEVTLINKKANPFEKDS